MLAPRPSRLPALALLVGLLAPLGVVAALAPVASAQQGIVDQFEEREQTRDGLTIPYRLFVPEDYDPAQAYPLVLALHGAGERGNDNERHIVPHRMATSWADPQRQARYPAFVVAPQVPSGARWTADADPVGSSFNNVQLTTLDILDAVEAEFSIDPDRVYVVGLSMGGHGVWDFISRLPERFAAAVPMSGIGYASQAERIAHIPIWAFHDEGDTVVRVSGSRGPIRAMEALGREVVYTECRASPPGATSFDCPDPIDADTLAGNVAAHADLLFRGEPDRSHGPWSQWFDFGQMADWLYGRVRVTPGALTVTQPVDYTTVSGTATIAWTTIVNPEDALEVWLTADEATTWTQLGTTTAGAGTFSFDTATVPDAAFAKVRLAVLNAAGRVYGQTDTPFFAIDNAGDAPPVLALDDAPLRLTDPWRADDLDLGIRATDPEGQPMTATVLYSADGGATFQQVQTEPLDSGLEAQPVTVRLADLPNAPEALLRVDLSDGTNAVSVASIPFDKRNLRGTTSTDVTRVAGEGEGTLRLVYVDEAALTGNTYRVTFDDADLLNKTYTVTDLTEGAVEFAAEPLSDGIRESPLFDGLRLIVTQPEEGRADLERTGWLSGGGDLSVAISGGEAFLALRRIPMLATETTYDLTIADGVVGRSVALFSVPEQDLQFTITAAADGTRRDVLYRDSAGDGRPWTGDQLFILEEGADGALAPAWELEFSGGFNGTRPEPGDVFRFVPQPRLGSADVFEFTGTPVATEDGPDPLADAALSVFPNPWRASSTISYRLRQPGHVRLDVFDVLGRRVAILADGPSEAGTHEVPWTGPRLAGGVHFLRLSYTAPNQQGRWSRTTTAIHLRD